jgi:hypothetical protein
MSDAYRLFRKVLIAELEDLETDIAGWRAFLEEKHKADKITEYVFLQNSALLNDEMNGIRQVIADLPEASAPAPGQPAADPASIRAYFLEVLEREAERYQFKEVIKTFIKRKIEKVYAYLKE